MSLFSLLYCLSYGIQLLITFPSLRPTPRTNVTKCKFSLTWPAQMIWSWEYLRHNFTPKKNKAIICVPWLQWRFELQTSFVRCDNFLPSNFSKVMIPTSTWVAVTTDDEIGSPFKTLTSPKDSEPLIWPTTTCFLFHFWEEIVKENEMKLGQRSDINFLRSSSNFKQRGHFASSLL